ncbi:MAG: hypothetical protein CVU71_03850 [Deltaproteobacteria bacterium HGW-Deltaproteobacteria-6]|nr:MAG: hypothetical protein CVU71_03850 [Deltaproteobacteria bacterium HGW-Deltaproteobacteria-6]
MKIGDEITWTHCQRRSSHTFTFTTRKAKIIHMTDRNIVVKYRGKLINLRPDRVRKVGEKTELTEMVMDGLGVNKA